MIVSLCFAFGMVLSGQPANLLPWARSASGSSSIPRCLSFSFWCIWCSINALLVQGAAPFSLVGGVLALLVTGTHFSISAAVGFISLFGVAVRGALILISPMRETLREGYEIKEGAEFSSRESAGYRLRGEGDLSIVRKRSTQPNCP